MSNVPKAYERLRELEAEAKQYRDSAIENISMLYQNMIDQYWANYEKELIKENENDGR